MSWLHAIFLAFLQGVTEFLPVSSSGHLAIFENLFGLESMENILLFDVVLHLGTLVSIFVAFRKDIWEMCVAFVGIVTQKKAVSKTDISSRRLILLIIIATLPLVFVVLFKDKVEDLKQYPIFIGAALIITALVLYISDKVKHRKKTEATATVLDVVIVGLMQALATVPGISRSGFTISGGLFRGFSRQFAVRFSFLMSIPAVIGATILTFKDALDAGIDAALIPFLAVGFVIAAVSGYFAIKLVKFISEKEKFGIFAWYCLIVGAATIIISIFQHKA